MGRGITTKKKERQPFTPLCRGCEEIKSKLFFRRLYKKFVSLGLGALAPQPWGEDTIPLIEAGNHQEDCPWAGKSQLTF